MAALQYLLGLLLAFLGWTLAIYLLHRIAHVRHHWNPLYEIHQAHHRRPYLKFESRPSLPRWGQLLFWLGDWRSSLDVVLTMTVPATAIALLWPQFSVPILIFHYTYEVFLSEEVLDHNPRINGRLTRWFAWGEYHLQHHAAPSRNFCLMITLWDRLFETASDPAPGSLLDRIRRTEVASHPR